MSHSSLEALDLGSWRVYLRNSGFYLTVIGFFYRLAWVCSKKFALFKMKVLKARRENKRVMKNITPARDKTVIKMFLIKRNCRKDALARTF
ncbi:MAG: hypothetical protein IT569_07130 [Leptospiraceae bacterium]|nr:hypothetical protein [Leptospiraceae bacterium]